ncbi:MAG TPA: hypothetical protein VER79_06330 [Candidatus Limnocylindrales bacterium]|nr:hypothetical protein [Candidatus Limnocylindrales bacterium]
MSRPVRILLLVISAVQAVFAVLFLVQSPLAMSVWPIPDTTPLTYIFLSSIFAAAAASTAWCALLNIRGALVGIALDYIVIFAPLTVYMLQISGEVGPGAAAYAVALFLGVLFGLWMLRYGLGSPITDPRPNPLLVRVSFAVIILALLWVGVQMVLHTPNVIPWNVTGNGVVMGWIYLGAAAYFGYALIRPSWHNAGGQLAGFLAYDLILIVPFLQRLPTVADEFRTNLIIYTIVVIYSGVLAVYFLFLHPSTRIWNELRAGLRNW